MRDELYFCRKWGHLIGQRWRTVDQMARGNFSVRVQLFSAIKTLLRNGLIEERHRHGRWKGWVHGEYRRVPTPQPFGGASPWK